MTTLFDLDPRSVADTSREAFAHVRETLTARQRLVFQELYAYLEQTGFENVTGGELTTFMVRRGTAIDVNSVRPRLSELLKAGWLMSFTARPCRVHGRRAHPFAPVLPLAAIERQAKIIAKQPAKQCKINGARAC